MAPNQNFDNFTFLVGPDLVQKQRFIKNSISYLASAFGTSRPIYMFIILSRTYYFLGELGCKLMIWPRERYKGEPLMCDGQCTLQDLLESVGNDNAKSGLFSFNRLE